jgi:predicted extracellular nuclease
MFPVSTITRRIVPAVVAVLAVPALLGSPATAAPAEQVTIPEIHGHTFASPYDGKGVNGVPGVVTAVSDAGSARGFWLQDNGKHDPAASSGLFVFTGRTTPDVHPGDEVLVSGTVDDHFPDAPPQESVLLPLTELVDPVWTVLSTGNPLPKPLALKQNTVPEELAQNAGGGSILSHALRPDRYALDFYKSHESELVAVTDARVVGPANDFGEMFVTTKPRQNPTPRGGTIYRGYRQPNTGRLLLSALNTSGGPRLPVADVGDTLRGATSGPLGYSEFGGYQLQANRIGSLADGGIEREVARPQRDGELAVGTYNVENLSPVNDQAKFDSLAEGVVRNLASPDIVSLEEIQDNNGEGAGGVVAADQTLRRFTDAIVAAGGPRYGWQQIDPEFNADGGVPNGNIRVVFLFNPKRVSFVDRAGGTATTATQVVRQGIRPHLTVSPGRIAPQDPAWQDSRKPLAGEFVFRGRQVFVIANHFNSKGGDQPLPGQFQPPMRSSETQRVAQAKLVHDFADSIQRVNPLASVVALGDLNDYQFSPALHTLTDGGVLRDLIDTLPPVERYSYVFEGNSQALDHILTSRSVQKPDYDVVHINAEFSDQSSDHDPQVLRFTPVVY